jgi:Fur-regulated basic protein B
MRGENIMKKKIVSLSELIRENKEEILQDKELIEKIEERIEEKYLNLTNRTRLDR